MNRVILFILLMLNAGVGQAQQLPVSSLYFGETNIGNPCLINRNFQKYDMAFSADLSYHYQWVGLEDAPNTTIGNIQYFNEELNVFFGGSIVNDVTHPTGFTGVSGHGGYRINFNRDLYATVGLNAGLYQYRIKGGDLDFFEKGDIANQNINKIFPDFSIGAALYLNDKYFIGISIPQTIGLNLNFRKGDDDFNIRRVRHYNTNIGAIFKFDDNSFLEPTLNVRYVAQVPLYYEAMVKYEMREIFWVGLGGTSAGSLHLDAGIIIFNYGMKKDNLFRIGYSYTQFLKSYGASFGGGHELKITYSKSY